MLFEDAKWANVGWDEAQYLVAGLATIRTYPQFRFLPSYTQPPKAKILGSILVGNILLANRIAGQDV